MPTERLITLRESNWRDLRGRWGGEDGEKALQVLLELAGLNHATPALEGDPIDRRDASDQVIKATYTEHAKQKSVTALDVVYALKRSGRTLYGLGA